VLADALAARGRAREALTHALALRRTMPMAPAAFERWSASIAALAITQASDAVSLDALWAELPKPMRRESSVLAALARRAALLRQPDPARAELEATLKRSFDAEVVAAYALLPGGDLGARLKLVENLLVAQPANPGLLLALGRLARASKLWGKAEDYLHRALSAGADGPAWEELGLVVLDQNDAERASRAFANAIAVARSEQASPLSGRASRSDFLAPVPVKELRDEHGVPRLP
jgi:HemY protein